MGWLDGLGFRLRQRLDPRRAERELEDELRLRAATAAIPASSAGSSR